MPYPARRTPMTPEKRAAFNASERARKDAEKAAVRHAMRHNPRLDGRVVKAAEYSVYDDGRRELLIDFFGDKFSRPWLDSGLTLEEYRAKANPVRYHPDLPCVAGLMAECLARPGVRQGNRGYVLHRWEPTPGCGYMAYGQAFRETMAQEVA